jgi:hypothetical protein
VELFVIDIVVWAMLLENEVVMIPSVVAVGVVDSSVVPIGDVVDSSLVSVGLVLDEASVIPVLAVLLPSVVVMTSAVLFVVLLALETTVVSTAVVVVDINEIVEFVTALEDHSHTQQGYSYIGWILFLIYLFPKKISA